MDPSRDLNYSGAGTEFTSLFLIIIPEAEKSIKPFRYLSTLKMAFWGWIERTPHDSHVLFRKEPHPQP